jgi:uncharacterized protein YbaR (Trm112 family)
MPANDKSSGKYGDFDGRVLEQLACPVCFGDLRLEQAVGQIVCEGCGRVYPIVDGIPVLIA